MTFQQLRLWHFMQAIQHRKQSTQELVDKELIDHHIRKALFHVHAVATLDTLIEVHVEEDYARYMEVMNAKEFAENAMKEVENIPSIGDCP